MDNKELIKYLNKLVYKLKTMPIYYDNIPIKYSKTGKVLKYKKEPFFANIIAIQGDFVKLCFPKKEVIKILQKTWKPIVLNEKDLLFPVNDSCENIGYYCKYYRIIEHIK